MNMRVAFYVVITAVAVQSVLAQVDPSKEAKEDAQLKQELILSDQQISKGNILDAPIDPDQYQVGAGDELVVSVLGQVSENFKTMISPEGYVILPSVLPIDVRSLTLTQAKDKIRQSLRKIFTNADIAVSLASLRFFRVHVAGAVEKVGYVRASAADRVSNVLKLAGGSKGSQRNILLRRRNGTEERVDLTRRYNMGDIASDPYVLEGDVVFVPDIYADYSVFGSVGAPGNYELIPGERLLDVLPLCRGLKIDVDSASVELARFAKDTGRTVVITTYDLNTISRSDTLNNFRILPDDRLFFRNKYLFHPDDIVTIDGEVLRPGTYPIEDQSTKVSDLVVAAGGFTPDVELGRIIVYRNRKYEGTDSEYERLKKTPLTEMNEIEKAYFKAKSRQESPAVRTDFIKLFGGSALDKKYDVLLRDGDHVYVAKEKKTVTLVGGVLRAGIYDLKPGQNYNAYIDAAGGYKDRAKKRDVTIIRDFGERWIDAKDNIEIEDADVIFVPEKEPIDGWELFKDILAITGQLATIASTAVLIYITVTR